MGFFYLYNQQIEIMKHIVFIVLCIFISVSCKKDEPKVPEPLAPEVTTGQLKGTVRQYNEFGTAHTSGLNTTTVSIDSSNAFCITDNNGFYSFPNMSSGTYTLSIKKPSCGLIKIMDIHYKFSDTLSYNVDIADKPTFQITNAYLKDTSWFSASLPGIYYNANTSLINPMATVVAIVGKSANIDLGDPTSYINFSPASKLSSSDYSRVLSYTFLSEDYGFQKDSFIFMKIYPVAAIGASYYDDNIKKPVYTAFGDPYPVLTLKMTQ